MLALTACTSAQEVTLQTVDPLPRAHKPSEKPVEPRVAPRASRTRASRSRLSVPLKDVRGRTAILACIRKAEGSSWTSVSPNGTFRGAYQANADFWRAYGGDRHYLEPPSWELAPHWMQSDVAWRGYLARGYRPWPPAMRACT